MPIPQESAYFVLFPHLSTFESTPALECSRTKGYGQVDREGGTTQEN